MPDIVGGMTERLLIDAGISTGMRVLDVGCGHGYVSFLAARLVGAQGYVLGVDRNAQPLAAASEQARELGCSNIAFVESDLSTLPPEHGLFDAAVARRVIMYLPDPVDAIKQIARHLRPGGLVVFQEHDATLVPASLASLPLHERVSGWIWQTVEREGANLHMGFDLPSVLERAGLVLEHVRAEAIVQTPTMHYEVGGIIRAMLPRITQYGIASAAEIDVDTLDQRLIAERQQANATYIGDMVFGVWARKPA